jgi:hypothetical protein
LFTYLGFVSLLSDYSRNRGTILGYLPNTINTGGNDVARIIGAEPEEEVVSIWFLVVRNKRFDEFA